MIQIRDLLINVHTHNSGSCDFEEVLSIAVYGTVLHTSLSIQKGMCHDSLACMGDIAR